MDEPSKPPPSTGQVDRRPIDWWLKQADALIDRSFADALGQLDIDRREWQILESLAVRAQPPEDLLRALEAFPDAETAIHLLRARGLIDGRDDVLTLTKAGMSVHHQASGAVAAVRSRVASALPGDDYRLLIQLLSQLVDGLGEKPSSA